MAKSKQSKLKKTLSPLSNSEPDVPPTPPGDEEDDLMDDLFAHLDSKDEAERQESANVIAEVQGNQEAAIEDSGSQTDSKSRFLARQARKAAAFIQAHDTNDAEADAQRQEEVRQEERAMQRLCDELEVSMHEINPDGHCLFSAVADQLALLGVLSSKAATHSTTRLAAANYMHSHPDEFMPFLSSEDGSAMSHKEYESYCAAVRDTAIWGGEHEILALCRTYNTPIHVIQASTPPIVMHNPSDAPNPDQSRAKDVARISYHRRMYGLGEHYNSLRPKSSLRGTISNMIQGMSPS